MIVEFLGPPAFLADRKDRMTVCAALGARAEREGAEALDLVSGAVLDKLFQGAIDLERRAQPILTQKLKQSYALIGLWACRKASSTS